MSARQTAARPRRPAGNGLAHGDASPAGDQPAAPPRDLPPLTPDLFINRELSWLEFNRRVLEEAAEPTNPLLERVKFVAIFSSNLDEFFMIRVAGVCRKIAAGIAEPGPDGRTPTQALTAIRTTTQALLDEQAAILNRELLPALGAAGIEIVPYAELEPAERAALADRFEREIFPILTPQAIDRARRFPHVSNRSLNLLVSLQLPSGARFGRVKIPATLPRFVPIAPPAAAEANGGAPKRLRFALLEQVVAAHLERLFTGAEVLAAYPFHLIRDSDIEVDEDGDQDADDGSTLMATMRESIAQRAFGPVVRLTVDTTMPDDVRGWLVDHVHARDRDLYVVDGPLAGEHFIELANLDRPDLKEPAFVPAKVPAFMPEPGATTVDVFEVLRQRDVLIHLPYQTFDAVVDFIRAASVDPNVVSIKQTLYRVGKHPPFIPTLIEARDDDTQVAVLVELKARFDEENNISWASELERHGVHVAYGVGGLKTHCKVTLVIRREPEGLRSYLHLSTGNYNAATARVYEDFGLFTSRADIGSDAIELFNALTGYAHHERYRTLWVAPGHLREHFLDAIEREIEAKRRSGKGRLIFKVNALVDRTIIRALYAASQAGVEIDLIVRGACSLRPGVPGWSDNIRVVSLVGRFLEHSRIFYFGNGGDDEVYLGSADLMERNLDRRVEDVFPVEDPMLAAHLRDVVLPVYLRDTVNARRLRPDGRYERVAPPPGEAPFDAQAWFLQRNRALAEARRLAPDEDD
jgi:polyphosphate kinase